MWNDQLSQPAIIGVLICCSKAVKKYHRENATMESIFFRMMKKSSSMESSGEYLFFIYILPLIREGKKEATILDKIFGTK